MQSNRDKNPLSVLGPILTALGVALAAWLIRSLLEMTCAPWLDVCMRSSQLLGKFTAGALWMQEWSFVQTGMLPSSPAFVYSAILVVLGLIAYWHRGALGAQFGVLAPLAKQLFRTAIDAGTPAAASGASGGEAGAPAQRSTTSGEAARGGARLRRQTSARVA